MANPDSIRPGDSDDETRDEAPAAAPSGTRAKLPEGNVFCSAGALSPEIDRILGTHIEDLGVFKDGNARVGEARDEFYEPYNFLTMEDPQVEEYGRRANALGIPVRFLKEKIKTRFKAADYYRLMSQFVDLVLYYAKKQQGLEVFARPIALANAEFHKNAQETVGTVIKHDHWLSDLENFAEELHDKIEGALK